MLRSLAAVEGTQQLDWPLAVVIVGALLVVLGGFGIVASMVSDYLKTRASGRQEDAMRQLIQRYEQLAEKTMDAQQRIGADVAELRTRTASIEQILRSVD